MTTTACFGYVFLTYSFFSLREEICSTINDEELITQVKKCSDGFELEKVLNKFLLTKLDIHERYIQYLEPNKWIVGLMIENEDTVRDLQILVKRAETIKHILETVFDNNDEPRVKFLPF
jgi:hypothetical protein